MRNVKVIDLTHPISEDLQTPAGPIRFVRDLDYPDKGFRSHWIQMNLHIGTHADAPMHTEPGGRSIDSFDPAEFYGDAVVLDFSHKGANQPITVEDVKGAEAKLKMGIQRGDFVLLKTLWSDKWGTQDYRANSPFLMADAAAYLIGEKGARGLGYDFSEEEFGKDYSKIAEIAAAKKVDIWALGAVHHAVLGRGRYHVEHLTNLGSIKQERVKLIVAPLPFRGLEASFCRVFAIEEEEIG
jgi:kynurenine formamidase